MTPRADLTGDAGRTLGLARAVLLGVGAIVGGGVLALAGTAFASAGPAALLAFALNGLLAFVTARSFAGMARAFPSSGGSYTYARMVLSVRAAFAVGWVVWFASIVAGALYALGFAVYAVMIAREVLGALGSTAPAWLGDRAVLLLLASGATAFYAVSLLRKSAGGGVTETVGKIVVFGVFIAAGLWSLAREPSKVTNVVPFLPRGAGGLIEAMGFTFIALQGFDLIAAVGGEVKEPARNIPRAMYLSLIIGLLVYLPLLFVVMTVGVGPGQTITAMSEASPDAVIALAARAILGQAGFWLIAVAALLSMLSALQANVYAASRIAQSMAKDGTLPWTVGYVSEKRGTPVGGVVASAALLIVALLVLPDIASAGAAASLVFLVTFAIVHAMSFLARRRGAIARESGGGALPVAGAVACLLLAVFQGVAVPRAGLIASVWMSLGAGIYVTLFARRAEAIDAADAARNPLISQARGHSPLVLLPVANPASSVGLVSVAHALTPPGVGRVLVLSVVRTPPDWDPPEPPPSLMETQRLLGETLAASLARGMCPEALCTVAQDPWPEIARVAGAHRCESLLMGMTQLDDTSATADHIEDLMSAVDCDVVVLRAPPEWELAGAGRILVPLGGKGYQDTLRARLLGSLSRAKSPEVSYLRVMPLGTPDGEIRRIERELDQFARSEAPGFGRARVLRSDDAAAEVVRECAGSDLTIIGVQRLSRRKKLFGPFAMKVVAETQGALLLISRRG